MMHRWQKTGILPFKNRTLNFSTICAQLLVSAVERKMCVHAVWYQKFLVELWLERTSCWSNTISSSKGFTRWWKSSIRRRQYQWSHQNNARGHPYRTSGCSSVVCTRTVLRRSKAASEGLTTQNYGGTSQTWCRGVGQIGYAVKVCLSCTPRVYVLFDWYVPENLVITSRRCIATVKFTVWILPTLLHSGTEPR